MENKIGGFWLYNVPSSHFNLEIPPSEAEGKSSRKSRCSLFQTGNKALSSFPVPFLALALALKSLMVRTMVSSLVIPSGYCQQVFFFGRDVRLFPFYHATIRAINTVLGVLLRCDFLNKKNSFTRGIYEYIIYIYEFKFMLSFQDGYLGDKSKDEQFFRG